MDKTELEALERILKEKRVRESEQELPEKPLQEIFPKLVLASQSPRRIELIRYLGLEPKIYPSGADESSREKDPALLTQRLAFLKAEEVQRQFDRETLIIGADTVVYDGERILCKPKTEEEAYLMLSGLSGRTHAVYTGVCLLYGEKKMGFCEKTIMHIAKMTEEEIRDYLAIGESMDKAGSYNIQGPFSRFVKGIEGDYYNVMGLPIARLYQSLKLFSREVI